MIDTAGTVVSAANLLIDRGATEVYIAATHGLLSGPAVDRLKNGPVREVVVTNTVPISDDKRFDNLPRALDRAAARRSDRCRVRRWLGERALRRRQHVMASRLVDPRAFLSVCATIVMVAALAACGGSSKSGSATSAITAPPPSASNPEPYPAPSDSMARARAAGLVPETAEQLQYHVHSHLDVFLDAKPITVPAGLGIDIENPGVHTFSTDGKPSYGGIAVPCSQACISPLHTHDITGILHTESATRKDNTLGQLFVEWNVRLTATCFATYCAPAKAVAIYVNGTKFSGDPTTIPLSDHKEIAVVVGTPPAQIPDTADWNQI